MTVTIIEKEDSVYKDHRVKCEWFYNHDRATDERFPPGALVKIEEKVNNN